jgi:hypothetical protein
LWGASSGYSVISAAAKPGARHTGIGAMLRFQKVDI